MLFSIHRGSQAIRTVSHIERYYGREVPCQFIPALGHSRQTAARPGLDAHAHDVYEICLLDYREVHWFVESTPIVVRPGWVFLTRPGQLHGHRRGVVEPCDLRWLQVDPAAGSEIAALLQDTGASACSAWPGDSRLVELHEAMLEECRRPRTDSDSMISSLLRLLLHLALRAQRQSVRTPAVHPAVARVLALMEDVSTRRWSLDDLQAASGVSRTRLQQLFHRDVGISPVAYVMRQRLQLAQHWLRDTDQAITQIALELGFSSSQHFATVFRQQYGMTPTAYRQAPQM